MSSLDADLIGPGAMGSRFSARSRFGCPRWDSNQILMILILLWLHLQFQKSGNHVETLEG